jgi:hypothetical protein
VKINGHRHAHVPIAAGGEDDAAVLAALVDAFDAVEIRPAGSHAPCPYGAHRPSDWRAADGGPVVCGVCHPPAPGVLAIPIMDETR